MVNFQTLIAELLKSGFTQTALAQHADCGRSAINMLATGKNTTPLYDIGAELVKLHKKNVGGVIPTMDD